MLCSHGTYHRPVFFTILQGRPPSICLVGHITCSTSTRFECVLHENELDLLVLPDPLDDPESDSDQPGIFNPTLDSPSGYWLRYFDVGACKPEAIPQRVRHIYPSPTRYISHTIISPCLFWIQSSSPWEITHLDDDLNPLCSVYKCAGLI